MILNGRVINPGEMRTQITLEMRTVTQDDGGFMVPGVGTTVTMWCRWTNVHGSEVWQAQASQAQKAATVLLRYLAALDETWTVLLGSERYEIVSVDNIQKRNEFMELKVRLAVDS